MAHYRQVREKALTFRKILEQRPRGTMRKIISVAVLALVASNNIHAQETDLVIVKHYVWGSTASIFSYGNFTLKNMSYRPIKDFVLRCTFWGESGTLLQKSVSERILSRVEPGKTRTFTKIQMGLAPDQRATYSCDVMSAEWG